METDKEKELPPLRFPLREALLSLHDSVNEPPSVRTAVADAASLATLGPYKVSSTEKSRALKKILGGTEHRVACQIEEVIPHKKAEDSL